MAVGRVLVYLQSGSGKDLLVAVACRFRGLQRDELGGGDCGSLVAGGPLLCCGRRKKQRREEDEKHNPVHLERFPAPAAEKFFCLTAMSMKALAARLSDLSLRNTIARPRLTCASANVIATRALARISSSIFDRAIKPTPTSSATKRFSSSLESSSMAKLGFRCWS